MEHEHGSRLGESEDTRIRQLGDLVQIEGQVLQSKLRLANLEILPRPPQAKPHLLKYRALLDDRIFSVLLEVKTDLV